MTFECGWCKEAGLSTAEYTHQGSPAGQTKDGRDLCEDCADEARRGD